MAFRDVWGLVRKLDALLELERSYREALDELRRAVTDIDRRLTRLEAREDIVVSEARAAARAASYEATQGTITDIARRIGTLEVSAPPSRKGTRPPRLS